MTTERIWTAALLVIGDEILSGRTQDRNVSPIATWLNLQGIRLAEVRVVPDHHERIAAAVNALRAGHVSPIWQPPPFKEDSGSAESFHFAYVAPRVRRQPGGAPCNGPCAPP